VASLHEDWYHEDVLGHADAEREEELVGVG
jgi:hypothetical protein